MLNRLLKHIWRSEKGITGLETAIILIAFVVVAAVFAYTALSAGLFATQQSEQAVYAGLEEAQSTMEMRGSVIATANTTGSTARVKQISFVVSNVLSGEPIDFHQPDAGSTTGLVGSGSDHKVVISYIDSAQQFNDLYWSVDKLGDADSDDLLEQNEKFKITLGSTSDASGAGNLINALTTDLNVNTTFTLEVKPPAGAVMAIERTTPAYMDTIMTLRR